MRDFHGLEHLLFTCQRQGLPVCPFAPYCLLGVFLFDPQLFLKPGSGLGLGQQVYAWVGVGSRGLGQS